VERLITIGMRLLKSHYRALLGFALLLSSGLAACAQVASDEAGERELAALVNQERTKEGLAPLSVDERLSHAARKHTALMVEHKALAHQFDGEAVLAIRFAEEHLHSNRQAENVALEMDVAGAHAALMNSPSHRANILSPDYDVIGVGVMRLGDTIYVTEDFAHRLRDYSESEADTALQQAITGYLAQRKVLAARKAQTQLRQIACDMALNDALDGEKLMSLSGVHEALAWNTDDPAKLPAKIQARLSKPLLNGYASGVCFAPSVSHPGGVYWVVLVAY